MKFKMTRRMVMIATVMFVVLGYCSAAVSLRRCDAAVAGWLPKDAPLGATQNSYHAEPSRLFLPFVTNVSFEKECLLAPAANDKRQLERGTRYYLTIFGAVMPLWTASDTTTVVS
jgi:hypothetical protein